MCRVPGGHALYGQCRRYGQCGGAQASCEWRGGCDRYSGGGGGRGDGRDGFARCARRRRGRRHASRGRGRGCQGRCGGGDRRRRRLHPVQRWALLRAQSRGWRGVRTVPARALPAGYRGVALPPLPSGPLPAGARRGAVRFGGGAAAEAATAPARRARVGGAVAGADNNTAATLANAVEGGGERGAADADRRSCGARGVAGAAASTPKRGRVCAAAGRERASRVPARCLCAAATGRERERGRRLGLAVRCMPGGEARATSGADPLRRVRAGRVCRCGATGRGRGRRGLSVVRPGALRAGPGNGGVSRVPRAAAAAAQGDGVPR